MAATSEDHQSGDDAQAESISNSEVELALNGLSGGVELKNDNLCNSLQSGAEGHVMLESENPVTTFFDAYEAPEKLDGGVEDGNNIVENCHNVAGQHENAVKTRACTRGGSRQTCSAKKSVDKPARNSKILKYTNLTNGAVSSKEEIMDDEKAHDIFENKKSIDVDVSRLSIEQIDPDNGIGNETSSPMSEVLEGSEQGSGGALWDIFQREDTSKLQDYLRKHYQEFRHVHCNPLKQVSHPIHDQTFYLTMEHKRRLKEEYGIEAWTFVQNLGEAVFIPAGCPHQVRNLKSCIKVALDFVSPENVDECVRLAEEFRTLPNNHRAKEDKLEVKKMTIFAVQQAIKELNTSDKNDDAKSNEKDGAKSNQKEEAKSKKVKPKRKPKQKKRLKGRAKSNKKDKADTALEPEVKLDEEVEVREGDADEVMEEPEDKLDEVVEPMVKFVQVVEPMVQSVEEVVEHVVQSGEVVEPVVQSGEMVVTKLQSGEEAVEHEVKSGEEMIEHKVKLGGEMIDSEMKSGEEMVELEVKTGEKMVEADVKSGEEMIEPEVNSDEKMVEPDVKLDEKLVEPEVKLDEEMLEPEVKLDKEIVVS